MKNVVIKRGKAFAQKAVFSNIYTVKILIFLGLGIFVFVLWKTPEIRLDSTHIKGKHIKFYIKNYLKQIKLNL